MALSLTTAIKNKVAQRLFRDTYANAGTDAQADIDGEGADALLQLESESKWVNYLGTGNAPDEWAAYFVDEIVLRVANSTHPDRVAQYTKTRDVSQFRAWEFSIRSALTYSPGSVTDAFVLTVQSVRNYVIAHCIKLRPRLTPAPESIDGALFEILNEVWNRSQWSFRRRPVKMTLTRTAFTGGTYTESTKTISGLTSVSTSLTGAVFVVTGGTNATVGEYPIASSTSTTIVLASSLGSTANASTDIAGFYYVVDFVGVEAGETFDSLASVRFYYDDSTNRTGELVWLGPDDFAIRKAEDGTTTGIPRFFRNHLATGSATGWRFSPVPDDDYTLRGEILVRNPAAPTAASGTFSQFAAECLPPIRRAVLDRVYANHQRRDASLSAEVSAEMEDKFPIYADPGEGSQRSGVTDVYGDYSNMTAGWNNIGGS